MAIMKVAVYAKIANTTPKVSIVTNANRNTIVHTENTGMKPMSADVCRFFIIIDFFLNFHSNVRFSFN